MSRPEYVAALEDELRRGRMLLVHGPRNMGKTTLLAGVAARARADGKPVGIAATTAAVGDVTRALAEAYPDVPRAGPQRQLRSRLRAAIERRPGLLVLDHLVTATAAMKGYLRTLRGLGIGVAIAADVDNPREHAELRRLQLGALERPVPPLGRREIEALLDQQPVAPRLDPRARAELIALAASRPGWVLRLATRLAASRYWRDGTPLVGLVATDVAIELTLHGLR